MKKYFDVSDTSDKKYEDKKHELLLREKNPCVGDWINLNYHYPHVWNKISKIYLPDDMGGTIYFYNGTRGIEFTFFWNIRNIVKELPTDAHIVHDENGSRIKEGGVWKEYDKM